MELRAVARSSDSASRYFRRRLARDQIQMQCRGRRETTHMAPRFFSRLPLQPPPPTFPSPQPSFTAPHVQPHLGISTETRHSAFGRAASGHWQPRAFQSVNSRVSEGGRTSGRDGRLRENGTGVGRVREGRGRNFWSSTLRLRPEGGLIWLSPAPPALHFAFTRAPIGSRTNQNAESSPHRYPKYPFEYFVNTKAHIIPCNSTHD